MYLQFIGYPFQRGFGCPPGWCNMIDCIIDLPLYHSALLAARKRDKLQSNSGNLHDAKSMEFILHPHQPRTFNPPLVFGCFFCTPPCSVFPPPPPPPPPPPFPCFPYFPPFCCTGAALTSVVLLLNSTG